jgi:hypothetical protein
MKSKVDPGLFSWYNNEQLAGWPSVLDKGKRFSLLHTIQNVSGSYSASYPIGSGGLSPGVKRPGCEADHSLLSTAKARNSGSIPPFLIRLHGVMLN